jgi:hypothetical protein
MKLLRRIHSLLGVFFAPLLVFFVATGWYQTVNPDRLKSPSEAETLVQKLRVVHTDQIYPGNRELRTPSSPKLFQWLVVIMSVALLATVVLGLVLAIRGGRRQWTTWVSLGLGLAVPAVILWLGHSR